MRARKIGLRGAVAGGLLAVTVGLGPAVEASPTAQVALEGLSSPKGLAVGVGGGIVVAQGAFGAPGPVLVLITSGPGQGDLFPVTEPVSLIDVVVAPDGAGWAISGDGLLFRQDPGTGVISQILDIHAYQAGDPDPNNAADDPTESNPYGLTGLPGGDVVFADAANNDIVRVSPNGLARTVARFDTELIGGIDSEAVPTTVTVGPGGDLYVGELQGFPFEPGTSDIWRIEADAVGAHCSVDGSSGGCAHHDGGYTAIHDIVFHRASGALYVYELAADGVAAFEEGFVTGVFPPAVLLRVVGGTRTELAAGELSQPGGVVVDPGGTVFVTDGIFGNGRLLRVRG